MEQGEKYIQYEEGTASRAQGVGEPPPGAVVGARSARLPGRMLCLSGDPLPLGQEDGEAHIRAVALVEQVLAYLPPRLAGEIRRIGEGWSCYPMALSEVRLRAQARSTLVLGTEQVPLGYSLSEQGLRGIFARLCDRSVYALRDTVAAGYLTLPHGIRVGVAGEARYDGGRLCSVEPIRSLAFRLPTHRSELSGVLYRRFLDGVGRGMLLFSLPGGGKTSALRELARLIGSGSRARRVVIVDERCEFSAEDYGEATVDILRGMRRAEGIALAMRTLSPEVLIVDEIAEAAEAEALRRVIGGGVPLLASAHADSFDGLLAREALRPLLSVGAFDYLAHLWRTRSGFSAEVRPLPC